MKFTRVGLVFGVLLACAGAAQAAEEMASKVLPTLLIKGEVVSVDANDPAATLLKVKDRYGFETPIFLTSETRVMQGSAAAATSSLSAGAPVEVEYNFDVNTAKRHAVSVKLTTPGEAAAPAPAATVTPAAPEPAAAPAEPVAEPEMAAPVTPEAIEPMPADDGHVHQMDEPAAEAVPTP